MSVAESRNPYIYNVNLTNADTEYSQSLPLGTKKITVKERDGNPFRLAFESGKVAVPTVPYVNILGNQTYWEDELYSPTATAITIYLAAPVAGRVVEIIAWT